ncbi:MAG: ATP-binding cassette domain-containing protein [Candidatus Latescibacteria bacterium]|nr:ATP-binding cassette domain-containing protein [Candidatus Latescibacterota bacterium]NIM21794.1 ATP-binding cassette domain-containing protein [Candidatus Latescibacterota bacterium]NIM65932.1 ATP-binding cassette domain-containing protein [Candidatus Latescibacterota bacterium]NIO02677.1 ATP-binding cassette domain-containing protein [Candidatus Latescibacterota bacterium]NIO29658.1 ATP-binding cassette domain-containing protein [Candidatus Latescibacterota bacterium]
MSVESVISIRDVFFSFGRHIVLENVSLDIEDGEFVAVIGPNGAGKTTLLKLILGLLEPQRGSVRVFGTKPLAARRRIGYMPQYPRLDYDFPVTVGDVVLMGRLGLSSKLGPYPSSDRQAADRALEEVSCADLRDRPFSALSGGQRQRVLIARALAAEPDVLLFDEPTLSLDPEVQHDLYELLHMLNERMTVIIVSHDVGFVSKYVQKIVCVNRTVVLHCASEINGNIVSMLYGDMDVRLVDHDSRAHNHD